MALAPTPVVTLNGAVAVAETAVPAAGLDLGEALGLGGCHVFRRLRRPGPPPRPHDGGGRSVARRWRYTPTTPPSAGGTCTTPATCCADPADGTFRLVRACGR
jgi:hypothetical protein